MFNILIQLLDFFYIVSKRETKCEYKFAINLKYVFIIEMTSIDKGIFIPPQNLYINVGGHVFFTHGLE